MSIAPSQTDQRKAFLFTSKAAGGPPYSLGRGSCILAIFAALLSSTTPSPLYPIYVHQWHLQESAGTTIFATYAIGTLLSLVLSGFLEGRVRDRRMVLLPALLLTAIGAVLFAVATNASLLIVGRFLSGMSTGLVTGTASAALHALGTPAQRKRTATLSTVAFTAGAACGPVLSSAALAMHFAPLVSPFIIIALIAALAGIGLALSRWSEDTPAAKTSGTETTAGDTARHGGVYLLLACLAVATAWMLGSMLMATGVTIAATLFGLHIQALAGLMPALFQLFAGIGQVVSSRLKTMTAILVGAVALALLQLLTMAGAATGLAAVFILAMPLCGLAYGAAFVGGAGLVTATAAPGKLGRNFAVFYVVGYLSNAIPTYVMGLLIDRHGLATAFNIFSLSLIGLAIVTALFCLAMHRKSTRRA